MSYNSDLVKLYGAVLNLCQVKRGEVLAVLGEGGDADAYLPEAEERGAHAYQINLRKRPPANARVKFSAGPNAELGGTNDTGCHLDLPLRRCDLFLDGQQILKEGQIVREELRAPRR
jgi:hypothetical protein